MHRGTEFRTSCTLALVLLAACGPNTSGADAADTVLFDQTIDSRDAAGDNAVIDATADASIDVITADTPVPTDVRGADTTVPPRETGPSDAGPRVRRHLLFESTFEGTTPLAGWVNTQHCCSYSVTVATSMAHAGSQSVRFELHRSDPVVSSGVRSEITRGADYTPPSAERWIAGSFYLPAAEYARDPAPDSIVQWHHASSGGSPPLALWVRAGRLQIVHSLDATGTNFAYDDFGAADNDVWINVVFHVRWATTGGLLEVFRNGMRLVNYSGPTTYDLPDGNYLKLGIYKWPWLPSVGGSTVDQRVLFVDDLRIGDEMATYDDVAP